MSLNHFEENIDNKNLNSQGELRFEYDEIQNELKSKEIMKLQSEERSKLQSEERSKQLSKVSDLEKKLKLNHADIIKDLGISNYQINEDDFSFDVNNGVVVIYSRSSYFSSLVGLNGIKEKENSLNNKDKNIRETYDLIDKKIGEITKNPSNESKEELIQFSEKNGINLYSIMTNGGCVINGESEKYVGVKDTLPSGNKNVDIQGIINHESQHIKFSEFCEANGIKTNGYLKILDEVMAHCANTKDNDGNIAFQRIRKSMKDNENYLKVSGFSKEEYETVLNNMLSEVENDLKTEELGEVMVKLIQKYKG